MLASILFIAIAAVALTYAGREFLKIRRNILLGQEELIVGNVTNRWQNVFLIALGQKKMFTRFIPAIFHFFIYAAFLLTQIELTEIFIDGIFGTHRFFADKIGGLYMLVINLIEILSLLAFVATFIFLARRNLLKIPRFQKSELNGFPRLDANIILLLEIVLLIGVFSMNGADTVLQGINPEHYKPIGGFAVSSWLGPMLFGSMSQSSLIIVERFGWWLHILTVFSFMCYLPKSKHLHIFLAFPNVYFSKLTPHGKMENMPAIMNEVKGMMGLPLTVSEVASNEVPEFGSNDVTNLSWKNILDAYSCTECGRCSAVCPANLTDKKLSPRKIMMDVRDRATEIGSILDSQKIEIKDFSDGKSLFDRILPEEIHACTTCNACVEACPVLINPLDIILKMRRYEILTLSQGPTAWLPMFNSLENSGAVWQMPVEREAWAKEN